ncbi:unnamed protein product, partial [Iphiclides podalirius]
MLIHINAAGDAVTHWMTLAGFSVHPVFIYWPVALPGGRVARSPKLLKFRTIGTAASTSAAPPPAAAGAKERGPQDECAAGDLVCLDSYISVPASVRRIERRSVNNKRLAGALRYIRGLGISGLSPERFARAV